MKWIARTASDYDPDWPIWFVSRDGINNHTQDAMRAAGFEVRGGGTLLWKTIAIAVAELANKETA